MLLGITGIGLAVVVRLVLREPVRGAMEFDSNTNVVQPPFMESLVTLLKIPSWWWMCFGIAFGSFVSYSFSAWQTKYLLLLNPDFNFQTLLIILGIINGTTYAGGNVFGCKACR